MSNKTVLKLLIGLSITTAATAIITIGVLKELQELKSLTIDSEDDVARELLDAHMFDNTDESEEELDEIAAIEAVEAED